MAAPIKIDGVLPPAGTMTSYQWVIRDMDGGAGTGRSEATGIMFRDRIGVNRGITVDIGPTTVEQMATWQQMVAKEFVKITYLDGKWGKWMTKEFYVADRGIQALEWDGDLEPGVSTDFSGVTWGPCTMEFIDRGTPIAEEEAEADADS